MKRGFTLMEMLVTISILVALAAFIIPTYQLILSQFQLTSATSQLTEFIRLTEQKTVTEQKVYGVTLTSNATTIPQFLYNTANGAKINQTTFSLPSNIVISQVNFSSSSDVRFATSGAPNVSGNVVLKDTVRNRSRRIEVRPSGAILANTGEF